MNAQLSRTADETRERLLAHAVAARNSRSWTVFQQDENGHYDASYAFSVTWTPGGLFLAGDLGALTVEHWHAFEHLHDAVRWVRDADFAYFMSKTGVGKVLDASATASVLLRALYERGRDLIRSRCLSVSDAAISRMVRHWTDRPKASDVRELADSWLTLSGFCACGWGVAFFPTRSQRANVRKRLAGAIGDACADDVAQLCASLGIDDYHGTFDYPAHAMVQFQAFKRWADLLQPGSVAKEQARTTAAAARYRAENLQFRGGAASPATGGDYATGSEGLLACPNST